MLTHTIRTFSLVGLIVIAHTIKPFSLGNVTAFARHSFHSFSFALPEKAVAQLEHAGELVTFWGGGWGNYDSLAGRLTNRLVAFKSDLAPAGTYKESSVKAKTVNKQVGSAGKPFRRFEKTAWSLQAHHRTSLGAAPLPIIPGIESSLIPSATLMAFPPLPTAADDPSRDSQGLFRAQPNLFDLDCEWRSPYEKQTRLPEEMLLKLQDVQFPSLNVKMRVLGQRASNGQACPQPGKATGTGSGNSKRSC